tara:strand:- start:5200 stop:9276 length:4077 start_codon:yes stop_codon:yes gene_type:complete
MSIDDQSLIGTILPTVHFQKIILESGGDTNPIASDDPHIMDKSHGDEDAFLGELAIDQIGEATNNKPNPKTWDATADINDEADTMSTTINFILKDKIDPDSQSTMWMFNNLFLNHVKLIVVQMAHYEYADSEAYHPSKYYESKIYEWLAYYNRKKFTATSKTLQNWRDFNNLKAQNSNIEDYIVQEFSLREVIEYGIPKYLDILKESPDSPTEITDFHIQNKIISSLLSANTTLNYSESAPLQIESLAGSNEKLINIPFQVQFDLEKEDPLGLSYMAFTYFDFESFSETISGDDALFPDIDVISFIDALNAGLGVTDYDLIHSPANVKEVIKDGSVKKTDVVFLLENNQQYFGNIKAVDPASNLVINTSNAKPFLDNGYNENPGDYTLLGFNYYTDNAPSAYIAGGYAGTGQGTQQGASYNTPFARLNQGDQLLTLVKKKESIINDSRIFKQLDQIQIQFENFSNNLVGKEKLHAYNQNIVLEDPAMFTDAWLSLEALEGQTKFLISNFMFGVDIGTLLEKQSVFSWFYKINNLYSDGIFSGTQQIINSIRNATLIKDFQIIRRAVKELNSNPDLSKDRFEPFKNQDPDPHTSGHTRQVIYAPMGEGGPITVMLEAIGKGELTHQVVSKVVPEFSLNYANSQMSYKDFDFNTPEDAVGFAGMSFEQLGVKFLGPIHMPTNQRNRLLFISGVDKKFPSNSDKRFQYGVRFKVEDGVRAGLTSALTDLVSKKKFLDAIENDIKVMYYGDGNTNFPIVDPKTGLFISQYSSLQGTSMYEANVKNIDLIDAVGTYLAVTALFSFDTEHVQIAGSESYKIVNKLRNKITEQQRLDLLNAISPMELGSAKLFLKFKKSYDETISSLRSLLKKQKTSKNQIGTTGEGADAVGVTYATQKNLIEVEHYFPQTLRSPSNGLTGYDYVSMLEGDNSSNQDSNQFKNFPSSIFDNIINRNCFKYFRNNAAEVIPSLPPGSGKKFEFGTPDAAKYNFLSPSKVFVGNKVHDLRPNVMPSNDSAEPFAGFDTTNINYSNAMLHIIARAETSKAEYFQMLDPTSAYNTDFQLEDSYIASQIMSARSCVVEGKSSYSSAAVAYATPEDPSYEPAYIILPAFDGASQIDLDSVEAEDLPGIVNIQEVKQKITQYQQDISSAANLLVHLIAHDEFKYMFNINQSNFFIQNGPSGIPSTDNLLEKLRIKYDNATLQDYGYFPTITVNFAEFLRHGLPNSIKYMFTVANSFIGGASSTLFNPYFQAILLNYMQANPANFNFIYDKEDLATIYFNFFNIVKVQYLSGFGITESGKISLKDPIWKNLTSSDNDSPDFYNQPSGYKSLCRLVPYDDSELINSELKYLDLPILNKYFFITI